MDAEFPPGALPAPLQEWFAARRWAPRRHQLETSAKARAGRDVLLIAPTGGGKTLAGFLPALSELTQARTGGAGVTRPKREGPYALYVSPLKALAVDVARNVMAPVEEAELPVRVETRTGDTPQARRARHFSDPPDILLTTPEQVALLLAHPSGERFFAELRHIIIDEIHALAPGKRGDLLALGLARLAKWAPDAVRIGLSATVAEPDLLRRWLTPQPQEGEALSELVLGEPGARAQVEVLASEERIPWSGHFAGHAVGEVYRAIQNAGVTLVFVNTRSQAEYLFQALWDVNEDGLAIALHHGSLDVEKRRKVEAAMTAGALRAVVCTSTLDLGIDWGAVDLVVQVGAPKGAARLIQRLGRANHTLDAPSRALLVPGNRFEVLECQAARDAVMENGLDGAEIRPGALDILCQHILGVACGAAFDADDLYREIRSAAPYAGLSRGEFDQAHGFAVDGGYALKRYDRFRRIVEGPDGLWRVKSPQVAHLHRMNVGAIVESPVLDIRLTTPRKGKDGRARAGGGRAGRRLGTVEEWFVDGLTPGDTFLFAGEVLRFEGLSETDALVTRAQGEDPKVPSWAGGKFPLTTFLAGKVRASVAEPERWASLPAPVREWLEFQKERSLLPPKDGLLVETFPYGSKEFLVCYPFDGRLAHQSLGTLLTRRLERLGLRPMGFVATEYALSIWGLRAMGGVDLDALFDEDMLGDDLESWLSESALMKRTFRQCALIAGLIERRRPGREKTGRQVTFSTDLIYDVLREHEPQHILLEAAWRDAAHGFLDLKRLAGLLARVKGRVVSKRLDRPSPLAVPVMLEIGREPVYGAAQEDLLAEAAMDSDRLIGEAMRRDA